MDHLCKAGRELGYQRSFLRHRNIPRIAGDLPFVCHGVIVSPDGNQEQYPLLDAMASGPTEIDAKATNGLEAVSCYSAPIRKSPGWAVDEETSGRGFAGIPGRIHLPHRRSQQGIRAFPSRSKYVVERHRPSRAIDQDPRSGGTAASQPVAGFRVARGTGTERSRINPRIGRLSPVRNRRSTAVTGAIRKLTSPAPRWRPPAAASSGRTPAPASRTVR